jgi:hypothetical protein
MPISNFPAALQPIIQLGYLEREFEQALRSRLGYRAIADRMSFNVGIGETLTKTRAGLKTAVTTPLAANTNTNFDIIRGNPAEAHAPLEGWVQRGVTVDLFKAAGLDFEALKAKAQTRDFRPVELTGVTFSTDHAIKAQKIVSKNVVARKAGRKHPDETVIYSAHWDHLGVGLPDDPVVVARVGLCALVAGDHAGRDVERAHQHHERTRVVFAEARARLEEEPVDRVVGQQRRVERVAESVVAEHGQRPLDELALVLLLGAPARGHLERAPCLVWGQLDPVLQ